MNKTPSIEKFDIWLNRIWKYILVLVAVVGAVWTVALAYGTFLDLRSSFYKEKEDTQYKFERQEKLRKRAVDDGGEMYKTLMEINAKQWEKMNELQKENHSQDIKLLEYQREDAYWKGKWDGRWEVMEH